MPMVDIFYYQEGETNKRWFPPAIRQKLEDQKQTKDGDQIYIVSSAEETKYLVVIWADKLAKAVVASTSDQIMLNNK